MKDRWNWRRSAERAVVTVGFVLVAMLFGAPTHSYAAPLVGFAVGETISVADTTLTTEMSGLWRKVQTKLTPGFNFLCEEWEDLEALRKFDVDFSTREITVPVDINEDGGVSSVEEGGWEAYPSSPSVEELSLAFITFNKRFTVTQLDEWIETNNRAALISSQIVFQGKKAIEAIAAQYGDYFYGYSTAYVCQPSAAAASAATTTITPTNGHGNISITSAAFITRMVKKSERVALIRAGAVQERGKITAKTATTFTVTWDANTDVATTDYIVKSNAMDDSITGTDLNKGLVGLLEMALSTSVHGLSSSTVTDWQAGHSDSTGGRFNGIRFHKGNDEVANLGGGQLKKVWMAQGVYRDMLDYYQGALQFNDAFALEADGKVTIKGVSMVKTRRVPPGMVIGCDPKSVRRLPSLLRKPNGQVRWGDGEKIANRLAYVFPMNFVAQNVVLNRRNIAIWTGLTEQ